MDLNKIVNDTMKELSGSGYVKERVQYHLKKTIDDVIEDCLRSYSKFGKELKAQVQEQMDFNLEKLDIPSYNHLIMNTIKAELERNVYNEGVAAIHEQIQKVLGTAKEEYDLSELVKEMVEQDIDDLDDLGYEDYREVTVNVEKKYGSTYIYMDPEEDISSYRCKYKIVLNEDNTVWYTEIGDKKFDNKVIMGGLYGFDATLFKLFTRKSKVIIDDYETSFRNPEHENY